MPTTIDNLLSRMTLEEKIGQMILASIEVSRMDAGHAGIFTQKSYRQRYFVWQKLCRAGRAGAVER